MKGVTVLYDESRKKRLVQIDMEVVVRKREELEEMLDLLVAESRKDDEMVPWEKAKAMLKKAGKL
ncbi:MAG TPA: hypothetical protein PLH93_02620 [Flavobacteriales bacterium]|nr:hypothetical protein [Flavobacteriales bacterium]HQW86047.1 hypothetical protein [Flavobacteriales bacterium]